MLRRALLCALVLTVVVTPAAFASPRHHDDNRHHHATSWADFDRAGRGGQFDEVWYSRNDDGWDDDDSGSGDSEGDDSDSGTSDTGTDTAAAETGTGAVVGGTGSILTGTEQSVKIQLTAYGAPDNNPSGSRTISQPTIHREAGGSCTFQDPVSFASPGSAGSTEFPKGQRVYFPSLKCYGVSEDSGATKMSIKHIDIYAGDGPASVTDKCESDLTGPTTVIVNPAVGKPVVSGPLSTASGCTVAARSR